MAGAKDAAETATPEAAEVANPESASEVTAPVEGEVTEVDLTPTRVVMEITIAGSRDGVPWPKIGETVELPADEAERFVRLGYASKPAD